MSTAPQGAPSEGPEAHPDQLTYPRAYRNGAQEPGEPQKGTTGPRRAQVRLDRYAIFDLGREHRLHAHARWLLEILCHVADFRSRSVTATYEELVEWSGIGRDTVPKTVNTLRAAGLISVVKVFGPGQVGEVEILAWDRLIAGNPGRKFSEKSEIEQPNFADT